MTELISASVFTAILWAGAIAMRSHLLVSLFLLVLPVALIFGSLNKTFLWRRVRVDDKYLYV
jgi:hypothetical protein